MKETQPDPLVKQLDRLIADFHSSDHSKGQTGSNTNRTHGGFGVKHLEARARMFGQRVPEKK